MPISRWTPWGALLVSLAFAGRAHSQQPSRGADSSAAPLAHPAPVSNAEQIATAKATRSHDYDLVHQRIEVSNFDWDSTSFLGRTATTLVIRSPRADSIVLDAGAMLTVTQVTARGGANLATDRHGDTLIVRLAHTATLGDTVRFTVAYRGRVDNGRGLTFLRDDGQPHRPQQIWSQGESKDNHYWFPTYDFPDDKMTWEVVATVPTSDAVVSNGRLVSDVPAGHGTHTVHWSQELRSASYLVSIIVAPLARIVNHWHGVPVQYYVYHEDSAKAERAFGVTPDMIDVYSRLTGVPYPWPKYAQTTVADFFGGMENVTATTLVDWVPDSASYHDRPWFQYILIPHELAHQWFGDYVTTENWANLWLNEGFAEFMPGQYWSMRRGAHAEQDYYLDEYRQYLEIEARRSMPVAAPGSNNIYPKGALVLAMLKHYLGNARFWTAIHYYLVHHAFGTALTEDLREAVLQTTGENLDWFWNEWLYNSGLPHLVVHATYDSSAQRVAVTVQQTQRDTVLADTTNDGGRYTIPSVFRMPLTIRVGTASGDVTAHAELNAREQTITVEGVRTAPTMVVVDDSNAVLKELTFEEPTPWLATQLRQDDNLWNRSWVIAQLGHRTDDSAAAAALADAARGSDYYLTREEAVTALTGFRGSRVSEAAERASHDTAAAVRRAASTTLAAVDSSAAAPRLRELLADPSYEVRAAALRALAQIDTSDRSALIARGLSTPSYQDVIQNAALSAAVTARDTSLIPRIAEIGRHDRGAMFALASFARGGNAHALTLLGDALDDARPFVWQSSLLAIARALPPELALTTLRSRVSSLTHPEAQTLVASVIARLEKRVPGGSE